LKIPPIFFAHTKFPDEFNLRTYASSHPDELNVKAPMPGSKSTVPKKLPVKKIFSFPS
jgi:hypothetical protein